MGDFVFPGVIPDEEKVTAMRGASSGLVKHPNTYQGIFMFCQKTNIGISRNCYNFSNSDSVDDHVGLGGFGTDYGSQRIEYPDRRPGAGRSRSRVLFTGEYGVIIQIFIPPAYEQQLVGFLLEPICAARTLQEIMRLILDWAEAPGTMRIQQVARTILRDMDITAEIRNILRTTVPDSPVAKYIKGDPYPRQRTVPSQYIDERIDHWLWYEFFSPNKQRQWRWR